MLGGAKILEKVITEIKNGERPLVLDDGSKVMLSPIDQSILYEVSPGNGFQTVSLEAPENLNNVQFDKPINEENQSVTRGIIIGISVIVVVLVVLFAPKFKGKIAS